MKALKIFGGSLAIVTVMFAGMPQALAHVTVKPVEVAVGQRLNFVVSVPTEEDVPTIGVRLLIPEGLQSVRPNVKPGWSIQLVKAGEGENVRVSEIIWSRGSIPAEQRDEFIFSAQAPAVASTVQWKAYQTYQGGKIVAWDADPKVVAEYTKNNPTAAGNDDHNAPKPYSETRVVDDSAVQAVPGQEVVETTGNIGKGRFENVPLIVSLLALGVSVVALVRRKQ